MHRISQWLGESRLLVFLRVAFKDADIDDFQREKSVNRRQVSALAVNL